MIKLIAAHDPNLVIGLNGDLPWKYSEDLKHFKRTTDGHTIVMGRKTFESIGSKPLPNRKNIVLSSKPILREDVISLDDPAKLFDITDQSDDIFIVGGSMLYKYYLIFADELVITQIKKEFKGDTFFPEYRDDIGEKWQVSKKVKGGDFDIIYYKRIDK